MVQLAVCKCPTDELAVTNRAVFNKADIDKAQIKHVELRVAVGRSYVLSVENHPSVPPGKIALAVPQRKWTGAMLDQPIDVVARPFTQSEYIGRVVLFIDFPSPKYETQEPIDSDRMAAEFTMQFPGQSLSLGELLTFAFPHPKDETKRIPFSVEVKELAAFDMVAAAKGAQAQEKPISVGQLFGNTTIVFEKRPESKLLLSGRAKTRGATRALFNAEWNFEQLGIGGVDKEFATIFRRAFSSRVFPPDFIAELGMKHVRGILLYGPPGTGKTLMARQIGKMLNAREPKIVNGPQILDKYVGESEANVRKLFAEAEEEWKRAGVHSGLHIIIFDEIDAICKQRGSMAGSSGVHDTVVNQLLSKMDGVEQLNNILVIGMTNRKDMIDDALMRPGRLEVQIEISLPDEHGRSQILQIHTARMRQFDKLSDDVDIAELARRTKNFSGAELEGLVRAAQTTAMRRLVKIDGKVAVDPDAVDRMRVTQADFLHSLEHDIKPAFGRSEEALEGLQRGGVVNWGVEVDEILREGALLCAGVRNGPPGFQSAILVGRSMSGSSCLAATIAKQSGFPFVKVVSPDTMVGYSETAKCQQLRMAFADATKSPMSILILDSVEALCDYSAVGPRYSNLVLQALYVLLSTHLPLNRRLLVLATSSDASFLREFALLKKFPIIMEVPMLRRPEQVGAVLAAEIDTPFTPQVRAQVEQLLARQLHVLENGVGVKLLKQIGMNCRECPAEERAARFVRQLEATVLGIA